MQDVGSKEDTELSSEDLTLSWRELSVQSLGQCQSVGNWMFFPARVSKNRRTQGFCKQGFANRCTENQFLSTIRNNARASYDGTEGAAQASVQSAPLH